MGTRFQGLSVRGGLSRLAIILIILSGAGGVPPIASAQPPLGGPEAFGPAFHGETAPLRSLPPVAISHVSSGWLHPLLERPAGTSTPGGAAQPAVPTLQPGPDLAPQTSAGSSPMPAALNSFEGLSNSAGVLPPDPVGDIGYDPATGKKYYVQAVNLSYGVWDVTGSPAKVFGPTSTEQIWSGLGSGNLCATSGQGDPVVLFDRQAARWVFAQFAFAFDSNGNPTGTIYECFAVSKSGNPTGGYWVYAYAWPGGALNDYTKVAVWSDGYYLSANQFTNLSYTGVGVMAFDRAQMLAGGASPKMVYFNAGSANNNFFSMLPADLDGATPPPAGAPEIYAEVDSQANIPPNDALRLWQFHVDWTTPSNSTFGLSLQPNQTLPVAPFSQLPCVTSSTTSRSCIPQPGGAPAVDAVGDRMMFRLAYRNFGDHQALAANHTVLVPGTMNMAGIRWYELRSTGSSWSIYQQGTYAPSDGLYRFLGSIAMDIQGDIALGYSVSSAKRYPSIRYTGRLASDPAGTLGQAEASLMEGSGSQLSSTGRWGDYSSLHVDPQDGCTFWYSQEYYPASSSAGWHTRIGSFRFPTCANLGGGVTPRAQDHIYLPIIAQK